MKRLAPLPAVLLVALSLSVLPTEARAAEPPPAAPTGESERLHQLFDLNWESRLRETPEFATYIGFPGHHDRWSDFSSAGIERRQTLAREQLKTAQSIDRGRLTAVDQVDLDLFIRRLATQVEGYRFPTELLALNQYDGIQQSVPYTLSAAPASSTRDYDDRLARLNGLPELVDQTIALLEKGLAAGVTSPKSLMLGAPGQVRALLTDDPMQSPLLASFRKISINVPPADEARIRLAALDAYKEKAAPAFRKLLRFLTETYIPGAQESISLGTLPDGAAWYAYKLRKSTTTDLTPQQIHELGLSEVKRIRAEMDKVIAGTGFQGSFADFVHPPGGRHRDPFPRLDKTTGGRLFPGQHRPGRPCHRSRNRPLHPQPRPGRGLQNRRAEIQRAARLRAKRARPRVRPPRLPRRGPAPWRGAARPAGAERQGVDQSGPPAAAGFRGDGGEPGGQLT